MASWACLATTRCEAVGLGLWVCGWVCGFSVWLRVFAGSRHTEPQTVSLSKFTGMCVPAWPSLCSYSLYPGELPGSRPRATASRRQGRSLPSSPAPSPASGAGGTSPIPPCSLTRHPGLSDCAVGNLTLPRRHSCWDTHSTY